MSQDQLPEVCPEEFKPAIEKAEKIETVGLAHVQPADLEVKPVKPIQIETAASRRFDKIAAAKEQRDAARAEAERLKAEGMAPIPTPPAPKPDYAPSEAVRRTQKLLEGIEQRKHERAKLVADSLRRGVEVERDDRDAKRMLDQAVADLEVDLRAKTKALNEAYTREVHQRATDLALRKDAIDKLDGSLESMRKNLGAELAKVDADLVRKDA